MCQIIILFTRKGFKIKGLRTQSKLMTATTPFLRFLFLLLALISVGCTTVKYYPVNFVESLKHPTKFPDVFSSTVQNIEEVAAKNPLGQNEDVKVTDVGENKNSSMHLIQARENGELQTHYHKHHDEVIYVKKGSGIATLDGTRYLIKPGSILQIPAKTVHKFLNTGGELFVAVSIFSPPFDGRDQKTIKEKKKIPRTIKEEKRLAVKNTKPEKIKQEDESAHRAKSSGEESHASRVSPKKEAEKDSEITTSKELDAETEKASPLPEKPSHSKNKKKPKNIKPAEISPMDIKDLHEKLTKLQELKEEGTLSQTEYEEKKDSLVMGNDIGELPAPKGSVKKKMPVENEPISNQFKKDAPAEESFAEKDSVTTEKPSGDYHDDNRTIHDAETDKEHFTGEYSSEDKLKVLEEMRQEGLISEDDYTWKRKELIGASELEKGTQSGENGLENEKIRELKNLYDEGLITGDDYEYKLKELSGTPSQNISKGGTSEKEEVSDKLSELNELKEEGLISEEDYEFKKEQLSGK